MKVYNKPSFLDYIKVWKSAETKGIPENFQMGCFQSKELMSLPNLMKITYNWIKKEKKLTKAAIVKGESTLLVQYALKQCRPNDARAQIRQEAEK